MLRLTLNQMRLSAGRLVAAGIAIVLGTAFVAAALLASGTMEQTTKDSFVAEYAQADLVLANPDGGFSPADLAAVRGLAGVGAADPFDYAGLEVEGPDSTEYIHLGLVASDPRLEIATLAEGRTPSSDGELALNAEVADRIGASIGSQVSAVVVDDPGRDQKSFTIVGLLAPPSSAFSSFTSGLVSSADWDAILSLFPWGDDGQIYMELRVAVDGDITAVRDELEGYFADSGVEIRSIDEIAAERLEFETGSTTLFLTVTLAFAAISLAVAGLVISNTFAVLVAQRTRTLALLRCVGASRAQVRASVLTEALVLGAIASAVGLLLGAGIMIGGVRLLAVLAPQIGMSSTVPLTVWVPVITLGVGIAVTVASALVPARMATRVAPVAALRPVDVARQGGAGRVRAVIAVFGLAAGVLALAAGLVLARMSDQARPDESTTLLLGGLALGILGGLAILVGLLLGSVFTVPWSMARLGALCGRSVSARIATVNAIRNPRRTAATVNALVIGVALVVMMSTGAATVRNSLYDKLDDLYPIDLLVTTLDPAMAIDPAHVNALDTLDGIESSATAHSLGWTELVRDYGYEYAEVFAIAPDDWGQVVRNPDLAQREPDPGSILMNTRADSYVATDGAQVRLLAEAEGEVEVSVVDAPVGDWAFITPETMAELAPSTPVNAMFLRFDADADAMAVVEAAQTLVTQITGDTNSAAVRLIGPAIMRAGYAQVIDTLLLIVLGLLGVAVIIAMVGVANTLSLSVIERQRESATLRAIGLTRGQLRGMLAIEGVLIAVMGALVGTVAGLVFGWVGAAIVLSDLREVSLGVPVPQLVAVFLGAVVAGVLASVLPARAAVRQSPVAALVTD